MKKFFALILALSMIFAIAAACGDNAAPGTTTPVTLPADVSEPAGETNLRIALVSHSPESLQDDGSFNAGSWNGIMNFIRQHGISEDNVAFFKPNDGTDEARLDLIESVIEDFGANVLVLPGFHFMNSLYIAQDLFPDVKFIFIDAVPVSEETGESRVADNLVSILYAEHESGFLAGYAAVMDGYRQLGFLGGAAVPPVIRYGHGFILGAQHAAEELGLAAGDVNVRYHYVGGFVPDPAITTLTGSWYADGTEIIFVAGGGILFSVIPAAETAGTAIIGVDVDQAGESSAIITSAKKELAISVTDMLNDIRNGSFKGGSIITFDATMNGVGLPMESSKFRSFTQAQYDAIFAAIKGGSVKVSDTLEMSEIIAASPLINVIEK